MASITRLPSQSSDDSHTRERDSKEGLPLPKEPTTTTRTTRCKQAKFGKVEEGISEGPDIDDRTARTNDLIERENAMVTIKSNAKRRIHAVTPVHHATDIDTQPDSTSPNTGRKERKRLSLSPRKKAKTTTATIADATDNFHSRSFSALPIETGQVDSSGHTGSEDTSSKKVKIRSSGKEKESNKPVESALMVASPEDLPTFTTPSGTVLTFQNAGMHLTHWCQAVNHNLSFEYKNVLPPNYQPPPPSKRSVQRQLEGDPRAIKASDSTVTGPTSTNPPEGSTRECEVMLPLLGVVRSSPRPGGGWPSKQLAKRSATFNAVKLLLERGEIDANFRPTPSTPREPTPPKDGDASTKSRSQILWDKQKVAIEHRLPGPSPAGPNGQKGMGEYAYITTPNFWSTCSLFTPDRLYATIIQLAIDAPHESTGDCRPLVLLTSRPLPILACGQFGMKMTIGDQPAVGATMMMTDCGKMKSWEQGKLEQALRFTERLMRADLHRPLRGDVNKVKWLVVPLKPALDVSIFKTGTKIKLQRRDIAWEEVEAVAEGPITSPFDMESLASLARQCVDSVVSSPAEFAKRSYIRAIRHDLNPSSPHPLQPDQTIYAALRALQTSLPLPEYPDQPILEVEMVRTPKHGGYAMSCALPDPQEVSFLLPEHVQRHCVPASVLRVATNLPHFFNALESTLIANEMNASLFSATLDDQLALQAITAPASCSSIEGHYERLEFIGDTLLKLVVTIHSYLADLKGNKAIEKTLQDRHVMSSNRTLQAHAIRNGIAKYVRTKRFKARDWVPRDWTLDWSEMGDRAAGAKVGEASSAPVLGTHQVGDKVLADIIEALIGASYIPSRDLDDVLTIIHHLKVPVKGMHKWSDLSYSLPPLQPKPKQEKGYMAFFNAKTTKILGYEFKDANKVDEVLSLDMNAPSRKVTFDRYKMLGNAVLDYFVVEHLWETYPEEGPASLSNMKASRTAEGVRSALAIELGLVDLLRDGDDKTRTQANKTKRATIAAKTRADEARLEWHGPAGGEGSGRRVGLEWWSDVPVTHTTSDPLEAFLGAMTHDASFDLSHARTMFDTLILPFMETYCLPPHQLCSHPKANLIRWLQSRGCSHWAVERVYPGQVAVTPAAGLEFSARIGIADGDTTGKSTSTGHDAPIGPAGSGSTNKAGLIGTSVAQGKPSGSGSDKEGASVTIHGTVIATELAKSGPIAVRRACEVAMRKLKDEGMLEGVCTCASLREGSKKALRGKKQ